MWEVFKDFIFGIIQFFYNIFSDWGMAIVMITIIFRLIVAPLMHAQTKSSYQMQKIQPKIQEIQTRFADDPVRQREEMQKLYSDAKFNPLAGCLPLLLQMPIFVALFQVLRSIQDYIPNFQGASFYQIIPDLILSPADALAQGFGVAIPYFVLMIIFAGATFVPTLIQQRDMQNEQQRKQMFIMMIIMSAMMLWIGWSSPAGVLLYWGLSSVLGIIQTTVTRSYLKKKDAREEELKAEEVVPVRVEVERKAKKKRPKKKR
jgi:YidC/Oxa1 family membrane protein insertase